MEIFLKPRNYCRVLGSNLMVATTPSITPLQIYNNQITKCIINVHLTFVTTVYIKNLLTKKSILWEVFKGSIQLGDHP